MNNSDIKRAYVNILNLMKIYKDKLIELDAQFGDGDLGISMNDGFSSLVEFGEKSEESDIGKFLFQSAKIFNENAPSSLGTIISFLLMGMAKGLKGKSECSADEFMESYCMGIDMIRKKAGSEKGEKTILDSLIPVEEEFLKTGRKIKDSTEFANLSEQSALRGCESTKEMVAVHGRAAYHEMKTLGVIDGGALVGYLMIRGMANSIN